MKNLFSILLGLLFFVSANAQFNFGFKAAYDFSTQAKEFHYLTTNGKYIDAEFGIDRIGNTISYGFMGQANYGFIYVQPEALYSHSSNTYRVKTYNRENPNDFVNMTEKNQSINIIINAGIKHNNFRLGGGPIFTFSSKRTSNLNQISNLKARANGLTAGFQGGFGYDYKKFHFDIRYTNGFSSVTEHIQYNQSLLGFKSTKNSIQIGVGYTL